MCGFTNIANDWDSPFTEDDLNQVINGIFNKTITTESLPLPVYLKTAKKLNKGVTKGYGKDFIDVAFNSPDFKMLKDLSENIYMFSGAKTYQQVRAMTDLLKDSEINGDFYSFKEAAGKIFKEYNEAYLKVEYDTAITSSNAAAEWQRIEETKDVLPLLQYKTVQDGRVRPEHAALNDIIRPVGDKFWALYYPPNGWNCRCTTIQLSDGDITDMRKKKNLNRNIPKEFLMNSGKDRIVYKPKGRNKHPYFYVEVGDKALARKNFNLPIPKPEEYNSKH